MLFCFDRRRSSAQKGGKKPFCLLSNRLVELKGLHKELLGTRCCPVHDMPTTSTDWLSLFLSSDSEVREGDESDSEAHDSEDRERSSISDGIASPCPSDSDEEYVAEDGADWSEEEEKPKVQTGKTRPKAMDASTPDLRYPFPAYRSDRTSP